MRGTLESKSLVAALKSLLDKRLMEIMSRQKKKMDSILTYHTTCRRPKDYQDSSHGCLPVQSVSDSPHRPQPSLH